MREMKESGVAWIGEMPKEWNLYTIGSLFRVRNEKVSDKDYEPLSVSRGGVVPQMENVAKTDANDNRKLVLKNDFAINSRSDRKQSCGVSPFDGSVSLINTVLYLASTAPMDVNYPNLLMKNYGFAEEFYRWGHGIVADLWTTRWQEMKSILLPVPSIEEQRRILGQVISELQKVAKLIANQEAQIEKLKAYKQSLITEVVTKGLDSTAPMKDSGVEWIGEIPASWTVFTLGSITKEMRNGYVGPTRDLFVEDGIRYIQSLHTKDGKIDFDKHPYFVRKEWADAHPKIHTGDVLIVQTGDIGQVGLVNEEYDGCNCHALIIATPDKTLIRADYLTYYLMSYTGKELLLSFKTGALLPHLNSGKISATPITIPPLHDQLRIVEILEKKCAQADRLIAIKQEKIEKLNEYKKSLIYEYVTGKKEVV